VSSIKVAIALATFKHEKFISIAVDGVLNQKTNFGFCAFIGDDASTDNTPSICKAYSDKYPNKITFIPRTENNMRENSKAIYAACLNSEAQYIALLDGDDYWTDENKLQKQLEFLESNPDFSMCFTNHKTVNQNGKIINEISVGPAHAKNISHEEILSNNYFISTASVLIRRSSLPIHLPPAYFNAPNGDYLIYALSTIHGSAAYININAVAYRVHDSGIWTSRNSTQKYWAMYRTFLVAKKIFTNESEKKALKQNLAKILKNLAWAYLELPKSEQLKFIGRSFFISIRFGVFKTWMEINSGLLSLFLKNKLKLKTA